MGRKEELNRLKVDDLRKYASSKGVKNIRSYRKAGLIEAIIAAEKAADKAINEDTRQIEENYNDGTKAIVKGKESKDAAIVDVDMGKKMPYIEDAPIGTIVAFAMPDTGIIKSAKIVSRSVKNRKLKLETNYKKQIVVSYENVIWVRSGKRWPKGIFEALKEGRIYGTDC